MRRILKYLLTIVLSFSMVCNSVFAADYSISLTSSSVTVGNNVSLKINGGGIIGRFNISSSDSSVASVSSGSVWVEDNAQSITINTKKVGSAVITVVPGSTSDTMGNDLSLGTKKITITVKAKPTNNSSSSSSSGSSGGSSTTVSKPKSSNSYLSSLTVDGYELDSAFDKESLEYTVTVKEGTEKVKINAQLADSSAKVVGVGEVSVSEGLNTFEIVVTAENGSKRTYVLKITVKEYEPIEVKVDKDNFNVVRKRKDLPVISEYFTEKEITIGEDVVDGYYNEELGYEVVGLKDSKGDIKYYIYKNGSYELYNEQVFNGMIVRVLDKELDGGYKKTSFLYNNSKINSYQEVKLDIIKNTYALDNNEVSGNDFYLFYGINMETGKEELYQFDAKEKTIQRYNTLILDMYKERSDKYYLYLLCTMLGLGVVIVSFSILFIYSSRRRKKIEKRRRLVEEKRLKDKNIDNNKKKKNNKNIDIENDLNK